MATKSGTSVSTSKASGSVQSEKKRAKRAAKKAANLVTQQAAFKAGPIPTQLKAQQMVTVQKVAQALQSVPKKNMDKLLNTILRSLTLPGQAVMVRYADEFTTTPTAKAQPFSQIKFPWCSALAYPVNVGHTLSGDDGVIFTFREYLRHCVFYDPNVARGLCVGVCYMAVGLPGVANALPVLNISLRLEKNQLVNVPLQWVDYTGSAYLPHGIKLYAGNPAGSPGDAAGQFIWLQAGETLGFFITAVANMSIGIYADIAKPNVIVRAADSVAASAFVAGAPTLKSITVSSTGYYSFWFVSDTDSGISVSCSLTGNADSEYWCHRTLADWEQNAGSAECVSIQSFAHMYSNTAPMAGRGGEQITIQIPSGKAWQNQVTAKGYDLLAGQNGAQPKGVVDGVYTYIKPSSAKDFEKFCHHTVQDGIVVGSHYPLFPTKDYLMTWMKIVQPSSSTVMNSQAGYLTQYANVEFATLNTWHEAETPLLTANQFAAAAQLLKDVPFVFDNPIHWDELFNTIKNGASKFLGYVQDYGPSVLKGAATIASFL